MIENFRRQYMMKIGQVGKNGFEIGNKNNTIHALHINFSIEKSDSETLNTAKVQVWNLSKENLEVLENQDCIVELKAGYANNMTLILVGNVVTTTTQTDGADMLTEIEVVDGRVEVRDTYISMSYCDIVNVKTILDYIAKEMGVSILYSKGCVFHELQNGFSYVGPAREALKKVCNVGGLVWSIQNQILQIRQPSEGISYKTYLLNAASGLLEVPKRIVLSAEKSDSEENTGNKKGKIGYEVRYFLNGAIGINDVIKLESKKVNGYFRVHKLTIDGDNLEGEWTCTAQLLEVI